MTDEDQRVLEEVAGAPPRVIGARLREAREKLGLSREEVALELRLSAAQIAYLENDEFERFAAPIFAKGFLRKYAELLGIPGDGVIKDFEARGMAQPSLQNELATAAAPPRRLSINIENWAPVLVAAGVVILLLAWLLSGDDEPASQAGVGEGEMGPVAEAPLDAMPDTVQTDIMPQTRRMPLSVKAADTVSDIETVPLPPPPDEAARDGVGEVATTTLPAVAQDVTGDDEATVAVTDRLSLRFTADSWVEISDGTGRRLMFDLGRAGQERTLTGVGPFRILLGYAPGVEIEYNGEPYDLSRHVRGKVARFTLGGP